MPWEPLPGERPDPRPVGPMLDRVVKRLGGPRAQVLEAVFGRWAEIAGEHVAAHCEPVSLRDGRLAVRVDDPVWATELRFSEAHLLARLAEVAGEGQVVGLDVRVGPAAGPAPRP